MAKVAFECSNDPMLHAWSTDAVLAGKSLTVMAWRPIQHFPFLFHKLLVQLPEPFLPYVASHPGVGREVVVEWKFLDVYEASGIFRLSDE